MPYISEEGSNNDGSLADDQLVEEDIDDSSHNADDRQRILPFPEHNRFLPIATIAKIMKKANPEGGKTSNDAKKCMQECVSEFISFITSEANDRCHMMKRKTINSEDILFALRTLGFNNYVEPLNIYLQKYREATKPENHLNSNEATNQDDDC